MGPVSWLLALGLIFLGCLLLAQRTAELLGPSIYEKDLLGNYLQARAVLDGSDPYVRLAGLAAEYLPEAVPYLSRIPELGQVASHPPFVVLMWLPLGLLPYEAAATTWLMFELLLLVGLAGLLVTGLRLNRRLLGLVLVFGLLFIWNPVQVDLRYGQLSILLAVLLVGGYRAVATGRPALGGVLVGTAIAVKLFPLALVGYLALKRRWSAAAWALAAAAALSGLATLALGWDAIASYLRESVPAAAYWRGSEANYSLFAVVWRSLAGSPRILPLVDLPGMVWLGSAGAFTLVWLVTAWLVTRSDSLELGFSLGVCGILLSGPVVWEHYAVLAVFPILALFRRLKAANWPGPDTRLLGGAAALTFVPFWCFLVPVTILLRLGGYEPVPWNPAWMGGQVLPGYVGLPFALLPLAAFILYVVVAREMLRAAGRVE